MGYSAIFVSNKINACKYSGGIIHEHKPHVPYCYDRNHLGSDKYGENDVCKCCSKVCLE